MNRTYRNIAFLTAAMLSVFAQSCDNTTDVVADTHSRVIEVRSTATRTTIGYEGSDVSHLEWVDGDQVVYVTDVPGDTFHSATVTSNAFLAEINASAENLYVLYPAGDNEGRTLLDVKATLQESLTQVAGEPFNGELLPMMAETAVPEGNSVDVTYECMAAVLRFTVHGDEHQTEKLCGLSVSSAESLAGNYTLNLLTGKVEFGGSSNTIEVSYEAGEEAGEEATLLSSSHDIYVVVPRSTFTDVDVVVTTDTAEYYWLDGSMDLTSTERSLYRIDLDLATSTDAPPVKEPVYKPVLSLSEVTDDGEYLIAVKYDGKYYVTNNVPTDTSNYYWVEGVELASNEEGVLASETAKAYTWQIFSCEDGYEIYSPNMVKQGVTGVLLISQGGTGAFSNEDGYEGKAWFVSRATMDGYTEANQPRRYWDIELDGKGTVVLRNQYDRGIGSLPCYKFCTSHKYFTLCKEGSSNMIDITLLKLSE